MVTIHVFPSAARSAGRAARAIAPSHRHPGRRRDLTGLDGTGIELIREPQTYHATAAT